MGKIYGNEGTEFEPASIDIHDAVCCEFIDLGTKDGPYGKQHQGQLIFQVAELNDFGERKEVRLFFNMTLGNKQFPSKFRKLAEKWRGKEFTEEEASSGFDPADMVGAPCRLDINQKMNASGDRTYAVVDGISKVGEVKLEPKDYTPVDEREKGGQKESESKAPAEDDSDIPF